MMYFKCEGYIFILSLENFFASKLFSMLNKLEFITSKLVQMM